MAYRSVFLLLAASLIWTTVHCQILYDPNDTTSPTPKAFTPSEPEYIRIQERCKSELTPPKDNQVDLFMYDAAVENQLFFINKTNTPNTNEFTEDCDKISAVASSTDVRSILFLNESNTCHDVLFFINNTNPVVCLYYPTPSTGQIYEPSNSSEREIEAECMEELYRPEDHIVSLIYYDSLPDNGANPGYFLAYTTATNDNNYTDSCDDSFSGFTSSDNPEGRPFIYIFESRTCHDVLFFANDSENTEPNPVVCLYYNELPEIVVTSVSDGLVVTTYLITSFSIIASAILLFTHIIFPSLRTLPSKVIMNLALSFLIGDIVVIIQVSLVLEHPEETTALETISLISFYFFYARWMWMAMSGFEMCRTIHVGTQLRFDSEKKRLRIFLTYILVGWSVPLLPVIIMAIVHFEELEGEDFGHVTLFGIGGYVITTVPVGIVVLFNIGIVFYLSYVFFQAHQWQIKVSEAISSHKRKTNFTRIFLIILSILGITWFLLLLIYIDGINTNEAVQVCYALLNTSQPIFVCIAFLGTKKIYRKYKSLFGREVHDDTETSTIQNRFRNRRLLSFLFTDKELSESLPKYRFGRSNRSMSKASVTSISMLSRDSSNSITAKLPPSSNGACSPPKEDLGLTSISEEPEENNIDDDSPNHVTVDLKESTM